jgi:hypothetical protein
MNILDILISSTEEQKKKGNLTATGISYLNGLIAARQMIAQNKRENLKRFKKALKEAANWQSQATEYELKKITINKAIGRVLKRIYKRYKFYQ